LDNQQAALAAAGCEQVFAEKVSGAHAQRPELKRLVDYIRAGDVIVVTRLDRLARNTRDLLDLAERLNDKRAGLRSLAEPWADTTSPAGKMLLIILAGIAEFERALIISRTAEGRTAALRRGVKFGPKFKLSTEQIALARAAIEGGQTVRETARALGIHTATLYRALKTG
jgi:DNA invertase Pin-like site-specific DNA recombinase